MLFALQSQGVVPVVNLICCDEFYIIELQNKKKSLKLLLSLYNTHWVSIEVRQVNLFALGFNIWMFSHHQPSAVGKEESPLCIVGVSISLRVLVMNPVITCPLNDVILSKHIFDFKVEDSIQRYQRWFRMTCTYSLVICFDEINIPIDSLQVYHN